MERFAEEASLYGVAFHPYPQWTWLVAEEGGEVVGTIALAPFPHSARSASVHAWYVPEAHREQGVGGALLDALEGEARTRGVRKLWITTYYPWIPAARGYEHKQSYPDGGGKLVKELDRG